MSKLQILSNGYMNSPKSCMLIFDSNRYLINCGEGTLRLILSSNLKPSKLDNILLTQFDWKNIGGLNGISKELEDFQNTITLHSNQNFNFNNSNTIKKYFFEKKFKIIQHDYQSTPIFSDNNVLIQKIDIQNSVCSYLFTIKKSDPSLIIDKLSKYNVIPGPWIRDLKSGIDYQLPNGDVIRASEVLDYTYSVEKKILFLDCTPSSLEFVKNSELINQKDMVMIIHLSESSVLNSEGYLDWIKEYTNENCIHLYLDEMHPNVDLLKVYEIQAQLNLINEDIFKLLPVQLNSFKKLANESLIGEKKVQKETKLVQAQSNMIFQIKPKFKLDLDNLIQIDNRQFQEKIIEFYENDIKSKIDGIDKNEEVILSNFKEKISLFNEESQLIKNIPIEYPNITFLGTASALPASTRNLSSILINSNESTNILLDCGENTTGQLNKYFGNDQLDIELRKLKLVYISHYHLDHFNGLYGLIQSRIKSFQKLDLAYEKLIVMYPRSMNNFLTGSSLIFSSKFHDLVDLIPNDVFVANQHHKQRQDMNLKVEKFKQDLSINKIETVLVKHIYLSYGISLELNINNSVFKLVYSGDCRPSADLVKMGKNCDLLIHECTFDNAFLEDAITKAHSTIGEALDVSKRMNAKSTVLTHFSLRYGKLANIDDVNRNNVGLAFDFMKISPRNFRVLNEILLELKVAFKEHANEIEVKRAKKLKL